MIRYCKCCIMPETRPDLHIDEDGICNACRAYERRPHIDWNQRRNEFFEFVERYRSKDSSNWDCVVPVSGGKDSTCQALKLRELGLNPLLVMATTCELSEIGRRNMENLRGLGFDLIEFNTNPLVRRKLNRIGLQQVGDISWPEHVTIFTIPITVAVRFNVPLIVWGENSENEYGGPEAAANRGEMVKGWIEEFGGLLGLRVSDMAGQLGIHQRDLLPYVFPQEADIDRVGVMPLFLGHYFPWDGYTNVLVAQANGFETWPTVIEGHLTNYENLDNLQAGVHEYFMFLKYGFGRATQQACLHIRRGRLERGQALEAIRRCEGKFPWTYLGHPLEKILANIDMNLDEFIKICDRFTNKKLFKCDNRGNLVKDRDGNLTLLSLDYT